MTSRPRSYDIAHLTSVHAVHDIRILRKECATLARAGYRVALVAGGKDEVWGGVDIIGFPPPARGRVARMTLGTWRVLRRALALDAKVYHYHDVELVWVASVLRLLGKRVIADLHEDLPKQIAGKTYLPLRWRRPIAGLARVVEWFTWAQASAVVTATPSIAANLPARKTVVVQNFPIEGELAQADPRPFPERRPWVAYVGGLSVERGALEMCRAMAQLPKDTPLRLRIAGTFQPETLAARCQAEEGWARVDALGQQNRTQVADLLGSARMGLVLFHPIPNHVTSQPNKLFEYMSAGLPLIASDFPLWREIVAGVGCGLLVDPMDPQAIAEAIRWIWDHPEEAQAMGRRGQEAVRDRFNWAAESRALLDLYERVMP